MLPLIAGQTPHYSKWELLENEIVVTVEWCGWIGVHKEGKNPSENVSSGYSLAVSIIFFASLSDTVFSFLCFLPFWTNQLFKNNFVLSCLC